MPPILLPVLLGAAGVTLTAAYLKKLGVKRSIEAAGALHEKQDALSRIITFAVLADGEVTDAEADNLRYLFATSDRFTGDPDEVVRELRECARRVSRPESLESTVRVVARDLDRDWKDDAFRFVAALALRGSGIGTHQYGFRSAPMSDPDALLATFARALDVDGPTRDAAIEAARALSATNPTPN